MKYSIIVPCYNGFKYLPSCLESILSQEYDDFELIVSDDHSTDGTHEYLSGLDNSRIKILTTPSRMSMAEHWEWALSHAQGEWCIFVGQDDGLQLYFFELADILTDYAVKNNCRLVASERAYYFWPGCENVYGDVHVSYSGFPLVARKKTFIGALTALLGAVDYFELPQMYTTSLFHKSILDEARAKQHGAVFSTHPQDANLAAIACSLDSDYVYSFMPLGWVGTSPKSAGMAISAPSTDSAELRDTYLDKVSSSKFEYSSQVGPFSLGSAELYLWGALLQTQALRGGGWNKLLQSKPLMYGIFCAVYSSMQKSSREKISALLLLVEQNNCSCSLVRILLPFWACVRQSMRILKKICNKFKKRKQKAVNLYLEQDNFISMQRASSQIVSRAKKNNLLQTMRQANGV